MSHGATIKGVEPADYGPGCGFGLCVTEDLKRGDQFWSLGFMKSRGIYNT